MTKISRTVFAAIVIVVAIVLAIFLLSRTTGQISLMENAMGTVLTPVQNAFTNATNWVVNLIENQRNYSELSAEYASLKRENEALQLEVAALEEEAAENDRLTDALGAYERFSSLDPVYGRVIARAVITMPR